MFKYSDFDFLRKNGSRYSLNPPPLSPPPYFAFLGPIRKITKVSSDLEYHQSPAFPSIEALLNVVRSH